MRGVCLGLDPRTAHAADRKVPAAAAASCAWASPRRAELVKVKMSCCRGQWAVRSEWRALGRVALRPDRDKSQCSKWRVPRCATVQQDESLGVAVTAVTAGLGFAQRARRASGLGFQRSPRSSRGRVSREGRAAMVSAWGAARVTFRGCACWLGPAGRWLGARRGARGRTAVGGACRPIMGRALSGLGFQCSLRSSRGRVSRKGRAAMVSA